MSQHLRECFARGRAEGRPLFVGYVTGGYPTPADGVPVLLAMEAGGADVIEIGVPFSDPLADGATIQHANEIALANGVSFAACLGYVREARAAGLQAPVLFMGYYNPLLAYGEERAVADAAAAGADGFIVVDLPPEEASSFLDACRRHDQSFVPLVAPTTLDSRIAALAAVADGFIYCVSMTGTTGSTAVVVESLPAFVERVRRHTDLPLAVGFGISLREHVLAVGEIADAAAVGSAIIAAIDAAGGASPAERVREFVEDVTGH